MGFVRNKNEVGEKKWCVAPSSRASGRRIVDPPKVKLWVIMKKMV